MKDFLEYIKDPNKTMIIKVMEHIEESMTSGCYSPDQAGLTQSTLDAFRLAKTDVTNPKSAVVLFYLSYTYGLNIMDLITEQNQKLLFDTMKFQIDNLMPNIVVISAKLKDESENRKNYKLLIFKPNNVIMDHQDILNSVMKKLPKYTLTLDYQYSDEFFVAELYGDIKEFVKDYSGIKNVPELSSITMLSYSKQVTDPIYDTINDLFFIFVDENENDSLRLYVEAFSTYSTHVGYLRKSVKQRGASA